MRYKRSIRECKECGVAFFGPPQQHYCPMHARERKLESRRNERKWYKENGWCYDCGRPALPGKSRCAECREKANKYYHDKQRKKGLSVNPHYEWEISQARNGNSLTQKGFDYVILQKKKA